MNNIVSLKDTLGKFTDFLKKQKRASATILAYKADITQLVKFLEKKGADLPRQCYYCFAK